MLLGSFFDEVAVKTELADQRVDLPETQRWFRCALQIAAHKTIVESLHFQSCGAGIFNARNTSQLGFTAINNTTAVPPGVFLPAALQPKCAGPDGILGTVDDVACKTAAGVVCPNAGIECLTEPGPDGIVGTADDVIISLANYTRTITITPLLEGGTTVPTLVLVTITINYSVPNHSGAKSYVLEEEISSYH